MKEFEEKRINDFRKTNPKSAFASEVGGAIATSVAATPAMALLKSPKFLMDLSAGMKAFITSGGVGAIYGAGSADEGERGKDALKVGTLSAFGGFLLQKPLGYVSSKYDKLVTKANQSPTIQNLKEAKNTAYTKAKELGIKFEGAILERFRKEGLDSLDESYDPLLNKYTASAKKLFEDTLDDAYIKGISFEKLDLLQRQLWAKLKESGGQEVKIYPFINAVNNLIKSHPDTSAASMAAKSANAIYNKAKTVDWEFTKVLNNKEISGSIGKKYKMAVRNILNNKNLRNDFDDVDIKTMESFLKGNISDKMLGTIGKLSPTNGGFIAMLQLGAVAFNPAIALASAVAVASKSSFNKRASKGAEKLLNYMKQFKPDTSINSAIPGGAAAGSGQALDQMQQ
jgi:predicted rRNA methylase YqxC with S4 and FtsJ domains